MARYGKFGVNVSDSGVYLIKNIIDGKVYVGSSKKLIERLSLHKHQLRNNKHHSIHLQRAWNVYGEKSFIFGVLEVVDEENLLISEQYYIDHFKSFNDKFGYNINPNAANNLGCKHTKGIEDKRKRMLGKGNNFYNKKHSNKSKYFIGLNNHQRKLTEYQINLIKEMWDLGIYKQTEIANKFNTTQSHISKIVNNIRRIKLEYRG